MNKDKLAKKFYKVCFTTLAIMMFLDLTTTLKAVSMFGTQAEMNPVPRWVMENFSLRLFALTKVAYSLLSLWVLTKLNDWSKEMGHIAVGLGLGIYLVVVFSNMSVIYG